MRAAVSTARTRFGSTNRALGLTLGAMLALVATGIGRAAPVEGATDRQPERWYVLRMQGARAGWMVEREKQTDKGNLVNETEMHLKIERMGQAIKIAMRMGSKESPDGKMLEMRVWQDMGLATVKTTYTFGDDDVHEVTEQLGRKTEKVLPLPGGDWLTPREAERFEESQIAKGVEEFGYDTIDASAGIKVVHVTHKIVGPTNVEAMGKTVPAIEWETTNTATPGITMREFVDDKGEMVRTSIDLAGLQMEILASDKAFAQSDFDAPELMASTMVHPTGKPIDHPRLTTKATYLLSVGEGKEMPELPTGGAQRFERLADGRARVVVDADRPLPATPAEIADKRYREPSTMVDSDDPAIIALVVQATKGIKHAPPIERARAIEKFVHEYISSKSLGVGFATATEVCKTKEGDCSEHAVLLAAMLRADGIPSRGVSGLVYVDQFGNQDKVFGYHMWAQGLIDVEGKPRWIDLDAAVYPFDATHIAVSTSSLADDDVINSMVGVADVLNALTIDVEDAE